MCKVHIAGRRKYRNTRTCSPAAPVRLIQSKVHKPRAASESESIGDHSPGVRVSGGGGAGGP